MYTASSLSMSYEKTIEVIDKNFSIFFQTDKTVYKPGETINYRILALHLVISPMNDQEAKVERSYEHDNYGVHEDSLTLSDETYFCAWELQVSIDNDRNIARQTISVDDRRVSRFRVTVEPRIRIISANELTHVKIEVLTAKYIEGSGLIPVEGRIVIEQNCSLELFFSI